MARANLTLTQEVFDAFLAAQDTRDVRLLVVKIRDESLVLDAVVNKVASVSEDFNSLLPQYLQEDQAAFGIFSLRDEPEGSSAWTLIAWVPDGCRVRDKMLYSSSREDLRRGLGLGYFKSEYGANLLTDLTWEQYEISQKREETSETLTETERLVLEEKVLLFFIPL